MKWKNIAFFISIVSIVISLITITLFFLRVPENSVTNSDTFISVCTGFITLSVTMLIGYQIYNSLDAKRVMQEQQQLTDALKAMQYKLEENIRIQHNEQKEGFDILTAIITYNREGQTSAIRAFLQIHHALYYSVQTSRQDYEWIFLLLRKYISEINRMNFVSEFAITEGKYICCTPDSPYYKMELKDIIKIYTDDVDAHEKTIRDSINFNQIQMEYDRVMKLYHKRIKELLADPNRVLTSEEKFKIMNPQ